MSWHSLVAAVALASTLSASADMPGPPAATPLATWTTAGAVTAIVPAGGRLYLGGEFGAVGPAAGPLQVVRTRDGTVGANVPQLSGGDVYAVAADGSGGWFLGGDFTYAGGSRCSYLVHVEPAGGIDPRWCPRPNGEVTMLARTGRTLYLGGDFTRIGGEARLALAAVGTETGRPTVWRPEVPRTDSIHALGAGTGGVFVAGTSGIARVDATTGRVLRWNPRLDRSTCSTREPCTVPVAAIAVAGETVYVAGDFDLVGGKRRIGFAALDARTARPLRWRADVDPEDLSSFTFGGWDVQPFGRSVYVSWPSTHINGMHRPGIAALDARTGAVQRWNPRLPSDADISAFGIGRSTVVIAYLRELDETYGLRSVDRMDGSSVDWTRTDFCCEGDFGAVGVAGTRTLVASSIGVRGAYPRDGLAAFDPATGRMLPWRPRLDGSVEALAASSTTLYIAGRFTKVDGLRRHNLASFDLRTGKLLSWNPDAAGEITSLALVGSMLYAGGTFTSIGGTARAGLAAVDAATGAVTGWDPRPFARDGAEIFAVAARGSTVYVAGEFTAIGGAARTDVAALDAATGGATAWDPQVDGLVLAVTLGPQTLFMAGRFSHVHGAERGGLAEVDLATGAATSFDARTDLGTWLDSDDPVALDVADDVLLVGDSWTASFGGVKRAGIAALDATTGGLLDWEPSRSRGNSASRVFAFAHEARRLYVGGELNLGGDNGFVTYTRR